MIQLQNVSRHFNNVTAVDNISLQVLPGETMVLLGTSGCGKTTTLRMINRLEEASSGKILVNDKDIKEQQPEILRRNIGYVLQHHGLFPHYTLAENIAVVPKLLKWTAQKTNERTKELMNKLQLPLSFAEKYPHQLSGGQQQRVGLARALAAHPPVLLMDEPFSALDPITRSAIRKEFHELDELKSKTVLLVTHDVQEAFEMGDKICLMDKGKIVQTGRPHDLLFHPANDFVTSFMAGQHFRLELENISIDNVWEHLPKAIEKTNEQQINTETKLWETLNRLDKTGNDLNYVAIKGDVKKQADAAALMAAYIQYKKSLKR